MAFNDHYSVLLNESVDALISNTSGIYVDGTFGRGGHAREILRRLGPQGKLLAFDKDPEAVQVGLELEREDSRFTIVHGSFIEMKNALAVLGYPEVDGVVLDLGVSSPQLDDADRGFSFMKDGPLDMRMNNATGQTAAQWLSVAEEKDIAHVIKVYGEERFGKRMARAIVNSRQEQPILTTLQLAKIVSEANPRWEKGKHPATRAFQAIRIYINAELDDLEKSLVEALAALRQGGRIVVISFHSLEDRIVKRFFRDMSKGEEFPISVPITEGMLNKKMKIIGKANKAGDDELSENIRSRSAIMRVAEKL